MTLDRNEPADAEQAPLAGGVRLRVAVRVDPVVDDLEAFPVEALDVLEIVRKPS